MIVYKFVRKESNGFSSIGVPDFKYTLGQYSEAEIIKEGSGIYCLYKHSAYIVSSDTKKDYTLLSLLVEEDDFIRDEENRVCVYKRVKPIREISPDEYNLWMYKGENLNLREIHFVYVTTYGLGWENEERFIVHSTEEVRYYQSDEYREQQLKVSGIMAIGVEVSLDVDDTTLRERLTVNEYCKLFPEVKAAIDLIIKK